MALAIWDDGVWQDTVRIGVIILVAYLLIIWVAALLWTYRDISARTRDPFTHTIAVLLVLVFNLPGLLLYLILRPRETLADAYDRQLEAEALLHEIQEQSTCPTCRRKIDEDFVACPYCRSTLRMSCESCGKPLASSWVLCPFCGVDREQAIQSSLARRGPVAVPAVEPPPTPDTPPRAVRPARRPSTATFTPPAAKPAPQADTAADAP
jgi:hypothetical protein